MTNFEVISEDIGGTQVSKLRYLTKQGKDTKDSQFKPFYKIDKSSADSKSSVGLGLSIASDIIRSHGGNIRLEKSPMNGLGVKIFLPV